MPTWPLHLTWRGESAAPFKEIKKNKDLPGLDLRNVSRAGRSSALSEEGTLQGHVWRVQDQDRDRDQDQDQDLHHGDLYSNVSNETIADHSFNLEVLTAPFSNVLEENVSRTDGVCLLLEILHTLTSLLDQIQPSD